MSDPVSRVLRECASVYPRYSASFVDSQVRQCLSVYPTLEPRVFYDREHHQKFFALFGTIPVYYGSVGATFHIPIEIVLPSNFPQLQPAVFVRPTPEMVVPDRHRHAAADTGFVYCDYLSQWTQRVGHPQESPSLLMLCRHLCQIFSVDPPVRQRPDAGEMRARQAALQEQQRRQQEVMQQERMHQEALEEERRAALEEEQRAREALVQERSTRDAVLRRVLQMIQEHREDLFIESSKAQDVASDAAATYQALVGAARQRQDELETLARETAELEAQVARLREMAGDNFDVDEFTSPHTSLHTRILECVAADAATDDVMYLMSKAVSQSVIEFPEFTKLYRNLAKQKYQINAELKRADATDKEINKYLM